MSETDVKKVEVPAVLKWAIYVIERVGFPTAITLYLLLSLGPKIDKAIELQQRILVTLEYKETRK